MSPLEILRPLPHVTEWKKTKTLQLTIWTEETTDEASFSIYLSDGENVGLSEMNPDDFKELKRGPENNDFGLVKLVK